MPTSTTTLEATGGDNVGIVVPVDIVASLGRGKRVPVLVTIDGDYSYGTTIFSMGGRFLISFNAEPRKAIGRGAGDEVSVQLEADDASRTVEVPEALAKQLAADPTAAAAWAVLSHSKQRALAEPIAAAKSGDTRARRVEKTMTALRGD